MRQQFLFSPTLRDVPQGADIASHQLMLRAGLIRQSAAGVYSYLPLGHKVLRKIESIVREEMDAASGQEVLLPAMQPAEVWQASGRYDNYGPALMRFKDRHQRDFVLGPTHEENIAALVKDEMNTYKRMPAILYQIQTKYRDEARPRFGVLRAREFIMKDAYSFDTSYEAQNESYWAMYRAYERIFTRLGLNYRAVQADAGAMGGQGETHEFTVLSDVGEDTIVYSDESDFAANIEIAAIPDTVSKPEPVAEEMTMVDTPKERTIEEVAAKLGIRHEQCLKTVAFDADGRLVAVLMRGDHDVNEVKVANALGAEVLEPASAGQIEEAFGAEPGFIGPAGLSGDVEVLADYAVRGMAGAVCGANENGRHYQNAVPEKDFPVGEYADLRFIQEGEPSPDGRGTVRFAKGIEVGHVFKLGTKYSEALGATFLDENGKARPIIMGSYGVGVSRTIAAVIEQNHDESGICWPKAAAPFDLHLLVINPKQEDQQQLGEELYDSLQKSGWSVLLDDRRERPGVKFKDADLYGLPVRIASGKKAGEQIVEVKARTAEENVEVAVSDLPQYLEKLWAEIH
ncbi:proline--tRNA ligase [Marinococcus halophilus]|uniref:Proline--tRNA ligase n=1 Tax=Marinococcus halophilus TaxID=1371 RepID=A0A510Y4F4_MARHA|nr:proline--tRNA ligase [Marinococcus halophilus]OZT81468.1 proline--tRNA ligase [Marinococcus halophilus]GEK57427.1 proline--tRNA ligase 1 [Marinococcus halophilus]